MILGSRVQKWSCLGGIEGKGKKKRRVLRWAATIYCCTLTASSIELAYTFITGWEVVQQALRLDWLDLVMGWRWEGKNLLWSYTIASGFGQRRSFIGTDFSPERRGDRRVEWDAGPCISITATKLRREISTSNIQVR